MLSPDQLQTLGNVLAQQPPASTNIGAFKKPCCDYQQPCTEQVAWQFTYPGCPYKYYDANPPIEIAPIGDRYRIADLNPLLYERRMMDGAEPDPYQYMNAYQGLVQFLNKDVVDRKDPYTRPITSFEESFIHKFKRDGPPQFTNF